MRFQQLLHEWLASSTQRAVERRYRKSTDVLYCSCCEPYLDRRLQESSFFARSWAEVRRPVELHGLGKLVKLSRPKLLTILRGRGGQRRREWTKEGAVVADQGSMSRESLQGSPK